MRYRAVSDADAIGGRAIFSKALADPLAELTKHRYYGSIY